MNRSDTDKHANVLEGMTSISALLDSDPRVNNRRIEAVWVDRTRRRAKQAEIRFLQARGQELGFAVEFVEPEALAQLTAGSTHGGIAALCTPRTLPALRAQDIAPGGLYAYLEGIEDPTDEDIMAKAEEILDSWDGTEDGFAALANEYSQDGGSNTNGGLYENVLPGEMVTEFNDWCFNESHAAGDTGIIQSTYGYRIMYFVGEGDQVAWQETVRDALTSRDFSAWQDELIASIENAELHDGVDYVS